MKTQWAAVLYSISLIAEVAGVYLLVRQAREAMKHLRDPAALYIIDGGDLAEESPHTVGPLESALRNQVINWRAAALLVGGIVAGSAANFLTL